MRALLSDGRFLPSGLLVPIISPLTPEGGVDWHALEQLADQLLTDGADGLIALATTGEDHMLKPEERSVVIQVCSAACADHSASLIVGAGGIDTAASVQAHHELAGIPGVRASLAVVPYYVRPAEDAIVRHFQLIADESPVPLILYNIPYRTGRGLGSQALVELSKHPRIVGLKQAVAALDQNTLEVLAGGSPDFAVLAGDDAFILPVVLMGGSGAIAASAHLMTSAFAAMIDAGRRGEVGRAREIAAALLPLVAALFAEPSPTVLKAVLHAQGRIATPNPRMPLSPASAHARDSAVAALEQAERALDSPGDTRRHRGVGSRPAPLPALRQPRPLNGPRLSRPI